METLVAQTFSFGDFELDGAKRLLLKQGKPVSLNSKAFDLLYVLVENHGQIVHKEELFDKVWEGQFVEENNLTVHISALRKIFGERKNDHQFIATIPGKGYKFVADVRLPFEKSEQKKLNDLAVSQNNLTVSASREFETTLIGREREIAEIKDLLRQNDVNLVTLTGAGGSGKTALARGVTDELKADFADGVFFVELAAVNQAELVIGAIAQALDVKESSEKSLFDALKDFLRSREILLVLDNFEQLISAAPLLQKLINSTAFLKILVTSRHVLKIDIERETVVTPLSLPPRDMVLTDENSSEYAAVELFIRRAQNIRRNFVLTGENASFVAEICRRLDGLPLAIELAAARVKLLSPQSILERLENSLNLLTGGKQDLPARQQTMRGAIQWSYDLLNEDEKAVLRQLSVFADGFTVKAAEAVCDLSERSGWLILDLFTALIDNNLLAVKEQKNGEVRLKMLEVVREFAFERLESHSETDKLKQNHAEYFLALAKETEPHLSDGKGGEWLGNLEVEIDNLRAALRWFLETDAESAAHLAAATREFWASYCYLTEGCEWLEKVLERSSKTPSEIRFKLLYGLGFLARQKGDFKTSQKAHEQGLKDGKAVGDRRQIAWSYRGLGAVAFRQNDFKSAREFIGKALQISRETDDKPGTANALNLLGDIYQAEGNLVVARPLLEESMAILKELEYKQAVGSVICNLGIVSYRQGDFAVANSYFLEALATAQEVGQKQLVSVCLDGFAALAIVQTKSNLAAQMAGAAEHLRETIGYEIEPSERLFRKDYEKKIRRALDEKTFDTAYQKGRTLALNEIVALAENSFSEEQINEIIVETHKFERVIIEEEIEKDAEFSNEYETKQINSAKRKTGVSDWLRNYFVILIGAVLLLAIIGGFYFWRQGRQSNFSSEVFVAPTNIKQLTTNGKVSTATLAPDGKVFGYVINDFGKRSLWLGYVEGGNHLLLRPAVTDAVYFEFAFAPDSGQIYFSYKDDKTPNSALYRIRISGGVHEKIADSVENFSLSPDGKQIAFGRRGDKKDLLLVSDLDGTNEREVASFPQNESFVFDSISWSPDGNRLAFSKLKDAKSLSNDLAILEISSGKVDVIKSEIWRDTAKTVWLKDGSGVIANAVTYDSWTSVPQFHVFHIEIPGGNAHQISNDLSSYGSSLSLSQNAILTIEHRQLNNIWIAPADNLGAAKQITFGAFGKYDGLWGLDFTPDGKIIYTNSDTKSQFISEMNADGSSSKPLTMSGIIDSVLNVSNDGRYIVFQSIRNGGDFNIWRMDIDGGNPQQLTFGGKDFQSFVSADNRWVYYKSWENDGGELRRVSIDGGEAEILNDKETSWLSFSPDGKYFAASYKTDKYRLAIFDAQTNQVVRQFDLPKNATLSLGSHWSPDSRAVAFRDWNDGYWLQPIEGGEPQKMEGLPKEKLYNFAWSKDGKQFAFVRGQEIRDVVLFRHLK